MRRGSKAPGDNQYQPGRLQDRTSPAHSPEIATFMGVESGGGGNGGRVSRSRKISRGRSPEMMILKHLFFHTDENFAFSTIFKIK